MITTTTPGVQPKPVLPAGISIQVNQTWKSFVWNHASTVGEGDPTLNGLLKAPVRAESALSKLCRPMTESLGSISAETAKAISQNYYNLPGLLTSAGFKVLDENRETFIKRAASVKAKLALTYHNMPIPASEMKRADDVVNQCAFRGVEVIVIGFSVTTDNPKGSRQRKSDGLYVTERVLRRVIIDKPLSEAQLQAVADQITGPVIQKMTRSAEYSVQYKGKDRNGNNVINVYMTSGVTPLSPHGSSEGSQAYNPTVGETNEFGEA